jgi:5-methylcytosine-specific restriction endonuclease McrA
VNNGVKKEGAEYWKFKQEVHEADGWLCKVCNRHRPLTVHHIIKRSKLRLDTMENCVSVCNDPCHDMIEENLIAVEWKDPVKRILQLTRKASKFGAVRQREPRTQ